jgi:hypothetical protein
MNIFTKNSKTEKFLYLSISILSIIFLLNFVSVNNHKAPIYADESSGSNEGSGDGDEKSSSNSDGEESVKEESNSESSEKSVQSVDEVSTSAMEEQSVQSVDEVSTKSSDSHPEDEMSTPSVVSVKSEVSVEEMSVRSGIDLDNFLDGEIYPVGDGAAIVLEDEKLFFVIPIMIEKEVTFDDGGMVLDVKQSLWMRILSLLSF